MLEPHDVPGAGEEVGGLAGLDVDGLGRGSRGPEREGDYDVKRASDLSPNRNHPRCATASRRC